MTLAFDFHPEAQAEFAADVHWYNAREVGVGGRFAQAVRAAIDAAVDDPAAWPMWPGWQREPVMRSKAVTGFPYRVVYLFDREVLTIVAVPRQTATRLLARSSRPLTPLVPSAVLLSPIGAVVQHVAAHSADRVGPDS